MRRFRMSATGLGLGLVVFSVMLVHSSHAASLDEAIESAVKANKKAAGSQGKVDGLSEATDELLAEYRGAQDNLDSLQRYNRQLDGLITSQNAEMSSVEEQIAGVTTVARELMPLMAGMLDSLEQFVELDVPFLSRERKGRVAKLREMMGRADVTNAEKFRRILEAYQVENEYGRTIESYQGELAEGERSRTVSFLRIGRAVLVYQTLDEQEAGAWDQEKRSWSVLDGSFRSAINKGLRIARKQAPPDLIRLPVLAPKEVR